MRVNRYMSLDTANLLADIVAFFHGRIRVLHTLRINNQKSGCFMAPLLTALRNHLIFLIDLLRKHSSHRINQSCNQICP